MTPAGIPRHCENCGQPLAPDASFCRFCGQRFEEQAVPEQVRPPQSGRVAFWLAGAIVVIGIGAAAAILLAGGGGSSRTTVVFDTSEGSRDATPRTVETTDDETAETPTEATTPASSSRTGEGVSGGIDAGRYVQAGSFRTLSHAEDEQERLGAAGVEVEVVSSDGAAEFYPGFQVLLAGPFVSKSEEKGVVEGLKRNGVPSAFVRDLSPAPALEGPEEAAGTWEGEVERSSDERPGLDGDLPVRLEFSSDGETGTLETGSCSEGLTLAEPGRATLTYAQDRLCISGEELFVRPTEEGQLMVTLLPLDSDAIILGTLNPG